MSAINGNHLPRYPGSVRRNKELHAVGDVLCRAEPAQGDALHELALAFLTVALPLLFRCGVGEHETRRDAVHRDAVPAEFVGHLPGEADLAGLRARVRLDAREAGAAVGAGGDVDDPAAAGRLHAGYHRPGAQERARQVRVDDSTPVLIADLLDRMMHLADHPAGVVHQDVHRPDLFDEAGHRVGIGDIHRVLVHAVHGRAHPLQGRRDRRADPVRGPGDQRGLACQVAHLTLQPCSMTSRTSSTPVRQISSISSSGRWCGPPKLPSTVSSRISWGVDCTMTSLGITGLLPSGVTTPGIRVQGKFSTQAPCEMLGPNRSDASAVRGALYQLWNTTWTRSGRSSAIHSRTTPTAGELPPCPFTIAIRRKPCFVRESSRSRMSAR